MSNLSDHELIKRYEPVLRFTRGEQFFPMDVESYVLESSLWVQHPDQPPRRLLSEDELTLEALASVPTRGFKSVYFLKFIEPFDLADFATYLVKRTLAKRDAQDVFRAGRGRLSRVGYTSRFLDALFNISLLARGRVPGDRAIGAALTYEKLRGQPPRHRYYARVVRQSGWVILQYWYFYAYNNWRSGYYGANDHEADWEMVNLYLFQRPDGQYQPEWVAYASHEYAGDDLRRHWDDPEVEKIGGHPVVYVAAGSHASYYSPGDYLTEIEIPFLSPFVRVFENVKKQLQRWLRKTIGEDLDVQTAPAPKVFHIPFVDYARGDGFSIGEGQSTGWEEPVLLDPLPAWALNYRGLWGYYARDPLAGENAPAGVCYTRDGKVRRAWYDPIGWAGLDKVPPPAELSKLVLQRQAALGSECQMLYEQIASKQARLYDLGVETRAMRERPHLRKTYQSRLDEMQDLSEELDRLRARLTEDETMLEVLSQYESDLKEGKSEALRAHLSRPLQPAIEAELRLGWLAEVWSALSIGLMLIAFLVLAIFARHLLYIGLAAILSLIIFIEAGFRRRLSNLINNIAITLAIIAFLVLFYEYFWTIIIGVVSIASLYMIWQNLRELWS